MSMSFTRGPRVSDFPLGGQMLLWATRHWLKAYRHGRMVPTCVWQSFAVADLQCSYERLCGLLRILAFRELDARGVMSPGAARLSDAEQRLMQQFEMLERSGPDAAVRLVSEITSPAVAREVVAAMATIANDMTTRGHRIGRASVAEMPGEQAWFAAATPALQH